jgi:hypothetical protein
MGTNGASDAGYGSFADKLETIIAEKEAAPEEYVEVLMTSPEGIRLRAFAHEYLGPQAPEFKDNFGLTVNQNTLKAIKDATGKDIVAPAWLMTHFKVPRALYDLCRQSCARVDRLMRRHGVMTGLTADPNDMQKCLTWWQTHDRAGVAALKAMMMTATPGRPRADARPPEAPRSSPHGGWQGGPHSQPFFFRPEGNGTAS